MPVETMLKLGAITALDKDSPRGAMGHYAVVSFNEGTKTSAHKGWVIIFPTREACVALAHEACSVAAGEKRTDDVDWTSLCATATHKHKDTTVASIRNGSLTSTWKELCVEVFVSPPEGSDLVGKKVVVKGFPSFDGEGAFTGTYDGAVDVSSADGDFVTIVYVMGAVRRQIKVKVSVLRAAMTTTPLAEPLAFANELKGSEVIALLRALPLSRTLPGDEIDINEAIAFIEATEDIVLPTGLTSATPGAGSIVVMALNVIQKESIQPYVAAFKARTWPDAASTRRSAAAGHRSIRPHAILGRAASLAAV